MKTPKTPTVDVSDPDFGAILICAIRYSMGRRTYMPGLVIDFITPLIPYLDSSTIKVMIGDIEMPTAGYGDPDIDAPLWVGFLDNLKKEKEKRGEQ